MDLFDRSVQPPKLTPIAGEIAERATQILAHASTWKCKYPGSGKEKYLQCTREVGVGANIVEAIMQSVNQGIG